MADEIVVGETYRFEMGLCRCHLCEAASGELYTVLCKKEPNHSTFFVTPVKDGGVYLGFAYKLDLHPINMESIV